MPRTVRLVDLEVDVDHRGGVGASVLRLSGVRDAVYEERLALTAVDDELQELTVVLVGVGRDGFAHEGVEGALVFEDGAVSLDRIAVEWLDEQRPDGGHEDRLRLGVSGDLAVDFRLLVGEARDGEGDALLERRSSAAEGVQLVCALDFRL